MEEINCDFCGHETSKHGKDGCCDIMADMRYCICKRTRKEAEVIEKLREALKPFAGLRVDGLNDKVLIYTETSTKQLEGVFTVGEVRQARTILKETEQK
jgi:hypothetical protein